MPGDVYSKSVRDHFHRLLTATLALLVGRHLDRVGLRGRRRDCGAIESELGNPVIGVPVDGVPVDGVPVAVDPDPELDPVLGPVLALEPVEASCSSAVVQDLFMYPDTLLA
eukprot:tig00000147_g9511.t1